MSTSPARSATHRGFSLMELMVVIAILGILITLVAQNVMPALFKGKEVKAKSDVKAIAQATRTYYFNNNKLPDSLDLLVQPDPKNFNESYLSTDDGELMDPWGAPYIFQRESGSKFTILTYGADGLPGGEGENADISSAGSKETTG